MSSEPQPASGFAYNGIQYVSWSPDEYENAQAAASMDDLANTNANWAGVLVTWYQDNLSANAISADSQKTPTDAALAHAIEQLHQRGLKVMLKPHVDGRDGSWRGLFNPSDPDAWFSSYADFITHYAQLAQGLEVEGFVAGTEFATISGAANQARWYSVLDRIRSSFSGVLTYAANASDAYDEFTRVSFWDRLDLLGLNAYFPLTNRDNPSLADLISAWSGNAKGQNVIDAIQNFAAAHDQPLIFTEIGYRSITGCNKQPWDYQVVAPYNPAEQANCYEAVFEVWNEYSSWMQGMFWWDWSIPAPSASDADYTPRGKQAAQVLKNWFGAVAAGTA